MRKRRITVELKPLKRLDLRVQAEKGLEYSDGLDPKLVGLEIASSLGMLPEGETKQMLIAQLCAIRESISCAK